MRIYDAIVLGVGGVGSAALYHLARRGARVVGIDRFAPPHPFGSTHGESRVIRHAYFEHADYVPLLAESYRQWRALENATGQSLLQQTGLVEIGPPDGVVVPGVLRAAEEHGLEVEPLTMPEIEARWPGIRVRGDYAGVFEASAGYLLVENCVRSHLHAATTAGGELLLNTEVVAWDANDHEVRVQTTGGALHAKQLIVAAGAWAHQILRIAQLDLQIRRKSLFWFKSLERCYDVSRRFPVYLFERPEGIFYGFPQLDSRGVKIAEHSGGRVVEDPLTVDRAIDTTEQRRLMEFASDHLPALSADVVDHVVCLYTMTPDEHFVVDRHPYHANVTYVAGLSGHGFKFAPVLGRVLTELALDGESTMQIEFLRADRFK